MNDYSNLEKFCIEKSKEIEEKDFFKHATAQANCAKILFEIMAHFSYKYKKVYESIKNITFSSWKKVVLENSLIKEFTDRGLIKTEKPTAGAFAFWKTNRELIWGVGLCINNKELYYMDHKKRTFEKYNIIDKNPVYYGVF